MLETLLGQPRFCLPKNRSQGSSQATHFRVYCLAFGTVRMLQSTHTGQVEAVVTRRSRRWGPGSAACNNTSLLQLAT